MQQHADGAGSASSATALAAAAAATPDTVSASAAAPTTAAAAAAAPASPTPSLATDSDSTPAAAPTPAAAAAPAPPPSLATNGTSTPAVSAAAAPPPPPPSAEELQRRVDSMCDEEYRAKATGNGTAAPPLLSQWTCELEGCGGAFVSSVIESVRATPRLDSLRAMVPCDLWTAIGNRTLWFFGDSQGQRFYRQARCFLRPFHDPPGQPLGQLFTEDPNYQQLIHRELLAGYDCCGVAQPMCTNLVGGGRICHFRVNKGWHMLQLLQRLHVLNVQKHDVIDFNVGLWHHMKDNNYTQLVQALADHVAANRASLPHLLWRDNSPQHFDIEHGEFPHPSEAGKLMSPFKGCKPFKNVTLQPDGSLSGGDGHVAAGGWRNKISTPIMQAAGVPIHYTWNNTAMMHDGHTAGECSHWCSPGAYSVSVWSLWRTILKHAEG